MASNCDCIIDCTGTVHAIGTWNSLCDWEEEGELLLSQRLLSVVRRALRL